MNTASVLWEGYSAREDILRHRFHQHQFYKKVLPLMTDAQFVEYLLQIGHIATNFVRWYETAKQGMQNEQAREVIRSILRDEIPRDAPTHQDDRLYDLMLMGVSAERFRTTKPSRDSHKTVDKLFDLIRITQKNYDLRVMVTLRVAGEVLVAEQYGPIVGEMKRRFGITPEQSRFYAPHYLHDMKGGAESEGSAGHTDAFDWVLASMITNERELDIAKQAAQLAFEARSGIHDQFTQRHWSIRGAQRAALAATAMVLLMAGGNILRLARAERDRAAWRSFVESLDPSVRTFYLDCDRSLLLRNSPGDLAMVGTADSCREMWGI